MFFDDELPLTVQVDAAEWSYSQRRVAFLHAMLVRVLRDQHGVPEWYSASELAALRLPGLPDTREGVARKARAGRWMRRQGGDYPGDRSYRYDVACLPARAFDALIARIFDAPEQDETTPSVGLFNLAPAMPQGVGATDTSNTTPAWVLPLMRLIKGKAGGDLGTAWRELPLHRPEGTRLPTVEEAATLLVRLGIAGR